MRDHVFQEPYGGYSSGGRACRPGRGIVRTALLWAAIAFGVFIAFGLVAWAFGLVLHLFVLLLKVALVTALVAVVWRRITGRRRREYDV